MSSSNLKLDLKSIKEVAIDFLNLDIEITDISPIVIHHPFFDCGYITVNNADGSNYEFLDITKSENLNTARAIKKKQILEANDVSSVINLIQKPYLLIFLSYIEDFLPIDELTNLFIDAWSRVEYPSGSDVSRDDLLRIFKKVDFKNKLSDVDKIFFENLPNIITVYRGIQSEEFSDGLSWTTDLKTAQFFANRFKRKKLKGIVLVGEIQKSDILAYINNRSEHEIICDIELIKDLRRL